MPTRPVHFVLALTLIACRSDTARSAAEPTRVETPVAATVRGRLLAHNGSPLVHGLVWLTASADRQPSAVAQLGDDGIFALAVPTPGFYWLTARGVDHVYVRHGIFVETGATIDLDGTLGTALRDPIGDELGLLVRYVIEGRPSAPVPVTARRVGNIHEATLEPPPQTMTVHVQLATAFDGQRGNAPGGQRFAFEEPYFWTEFDVPGDRRLRIDTRRLPPADVPTKVTLTGAKVVEAAAIESRLVPMGARARAVAKGNGPDTVERLSEIVDQARQEFATEADVDLRHQLALTFALMFGGFVQRELVAAESLAWVLEMVPASSPQWAAHAIEMPSLLVTVLPRGATTSAYLEAMASHADPGVRAAALQTRIEQARRRGDAASIDTLTAEMSREFPGAIWATHPTSDQ